MELEKQGFKAIIEQEEQPTDPREEFDHVTQMWFYHGRYQLGDYKDKERPKEPVHGLKDIEQALGRKVIAVRPVYMYAHSGLTIKTSPFSCPWDSGQIGFVFVTLDTAKRESGKKSLKAMQAWALQMIEHEIAEYDQHLTGDVYYVVVKDRRGNTVDTLGQIFGYEYAKEQAAEMLDQCIAYASKKWRERLSRERQERRERRYWEARDVITV